MIEYESSMIVAGSLASLLASVGTLLGALMIWTIKDLSIRARDMLLSSAAGVMLAATVFSLLLPGIAHGEARGLSSGWAAIVVTLGMVLGAAVLAFIHSLTPHEHFLKGREGINSKRVNGIWLFVIAIALHNFPEGMAGVERSSGIPLTIGIFLQNIPEGLAIAVALYSIGYSRAFGFNVAVLTGLIEPVGGLFGATLVSIATPILPWILGGAGGAMLFIISNEIIPESHKDGHERAATFSLMAGFGLMMILDTAMG